MMRKGKHRWIWIMSFSAVLLLIMIFFSLHLGAVNLPFAQVIEEIRFKEGITFDYRLPRLLIGICVGVNMAVAGAILQGVTRNPLAAPDLIGVTAGGGLATVVLILAVPAFSAAMLPLFAFGGSIAAGLLVYGLAYKNGLMPERLALCGVAVSTGIQALITLFIVKFSPSAAQALIWLKGSLYARSWEHVEMIWPWTVMGLVAALFCSRPLNALLLSEEIVRGLGMRVERTRLMLIAVAVVMAGSAVAVAGTIGFIGLVIPHLARLLVGSNFRLVLPVSALLGAILVVTADLVGRIIMPPIEVPAGIVTAILGTPYFLFLLLRKK